MICNNCGKRLPEIAKFCDSCGSAVSERTLKVEHEECAGCGTIIDSQMRICPCCGRKIPGRTATDYIQKLLDEMNKARNAREKIKIIRKFLHLQTNK